MWTVLLSGSNRNLITLAVLLTCSSVLFCSPQGLETVDSSNTDTFRVLADKRLEQPLTSITREYERRTGSRIKLSFLSVSEVNTLVVNEESGCDVVLCMPTNIDSRTAVSTIRDARKVAWRYPSGEPVWAAVLTNHSGATGFVSFIGGATGHRLWSESKAGFTITSGETHAEAFEWVVENRVKHTYPLTAMRMLGECGGIREGICIDIGCGTGNLDIELAKRSNFTIIGLDIDPDMKPLFEKRIRKASLQDRVSFVVGDAQKMPFRDDYADVIFSRGTLTFIPDIKKCLREIDRVLKPTGVAFVGGRYIYTPQSHKISTQKLKEIVHESGIPGAQVIDMRGQWVKIIGPQAPKAAQQFQSGPDMLAARLIADYGITEGKCLLICGNDGGLQQILQRGLANMTGLKITALYPSEQVVSQAGKRIQNEKLGDRITCRTGAIRALPFEDTSFDLVVGVGPVLIREKDKENAMCEINRILRPGGVALVGGRYRGMPAAFKVSTESLRQAAVRTKIDSIQVFDDMGQWVEISKNIKEGM